MPNIKPILWGPSTWKTIFYIIAVYPEKPNNEEIESIHNFFLSLKNLLPCSGCRTSYSIYLNEKDTNINDLINFNSRDNLIKFVFLLKNKVNLKLGCNYNLSLSYFKKKLDKLISNNNNNSDSHINNFCEVPVIEKDIEEKILNYLKKKTDYKISHTIEIIKNVNNFYKNPTFDHKNEQFKLINKRNTLCKSIIDKIYIKMSNGNYSLIESFSKDKEHHLKLFYLGCNIIPNDQIIKLL